jgi:hypothetical protein
MFIQNMTGTYAFTGAVNLRLPNNNTGDALHVTGNQNVTFSGGFGMTAGSQGNRNIRIDGSSTVTINSIARQFGGGATNLNVLGDGTLTVNGVGNMAGTLTMGSSGRLNWNTRLGQEIGSTGNTGFTSIVLNDGSFFANGQGNTSLTWNAGTLVFDLSNVDSTSNTIALQGDFTKGSGSTFEIDFQNTGIEETYTLLAFGSTTFSLSDFTAINSPQPGTFSFGTTTINDVELTTLLYTIPEPRVYAALFGLLALGFVAWRRRR